jgi:hypothetical protein
LNREFSEVQMAKKVHEERIDILSHKANTHQKDTEIPAHLCQNGYHQENNQQQKLVRIGRGGGTLIHCCQEM